ncbi:MAG TPA: ATP-grasp domain-containing protein [Acidobacteriota bacterium]|nr:ATP-grasp domain-containing protein [Acidobacteriota bacterium]
MNDPFPRVGIVFNAYEPRPVNTGERLSEESVAEMANQVHGAVKALGYDATLIPLQRSLLNFLGRVKELNLDVLVNLCEGFYGRPQWESNVAAVFELLGIAFTGNNSRTLAFCQDKYKAKAILAAHGLPTAPSQFVTSADQPLELRLPVIVKPNSEDASLGIYPESVVRDAASFAVQVRRILEKYNQPALAEAFIDGREFNVSVYENTAPEALPVSELDFSAMPASSPRICSYEAKWFEDHALYNATPPVCPAPIDDVLRTKLQAAAVGAFKAMGCRDYARVDFRMDGKGQLFILEVNPNPDISLNAGFARALKAANVPYEAFWKILIGNARKRKEAHDTPDVSVR